MVFALPPSEGEPFDELNDILRSINQHAGPEGYAVVLLRTKKSKLKVTCKAWIICDRGRKIPESKGRGRRDTNSRQSQCPFSIVAKLANENSGPWYHEIKNAEHNHPSSIAAAHPVLRRMAMTREVKTNISRQLAVRTTPYQVISSLRVENSDVAENIQPADAESPNPSSIATSIHPMFKPRDIYNMQARIRQDQLGPYTATQALMRHLDQQDWFYAFQNDRTGRLTHLFFSRGTSQIILKKNYEVLVMDATYKTNRYRMPLLIISGQTALHTTFYVAFAFIANERVDDYKWVLQQLRGLYAKLELPDPTVVITDMEKGLIAARQFIFPETAHLLCLWHINKNVAANCKKAFNSKESWDVFFSEWNVIVHASSLDEYQRLWNDFDEKYSPTHGDCVQYLLDTYIIFHYRRFVKCFTNQVLHFGTTVTSRGEGGHATLKRHLNNSTGDLKLVVDNINMLLIHEYDNHLIAFDEAKTRYPLKLQRPIFENLMGTVAPFAIKKILPQYEMLTDHPTVLSRCTNVFTKTMGLPCSHKIQQRLYDTGYLLIEDVHPHWRFERNEPPQQSVIDPLLLVREPEVVRPRGRPPNAENIRSSQINQVAPEEMEITRREQAFQDSTNREPSRFEHVEMETAILHDQVVDPAIERAVRRAAPAAKMGRGRPRRNRAGQRRDEAINEGVGGANGGNGGGEGGEGGEGVRGEEVSATARRGRSRRMELASEQLDPSVISGRS